MGEIKGKSGYLIGIYREKKPQGFVFLWTRREGAETISLVLNALREVDKSLRKKKRGYLLIEFFSRPERISLKYPEADTLGLYSFPLHAFLDEEGVFKKRLFLIGIENLLKWKGDFFPSNWIGGVARQNDFFDREDFIEEIRKKIEKTNLIIAGPRRYGKTSLLFRLMDENVYGGKAIHVDLEGVRNPRDFVAKLKATISVETGDEEKKDELRKKALQEMVSWRESGDELFQAFEDKKYLFLFDEFSFMLENFEDEKVEIEEMRDFLLWLKEKRQQCPRSRFLLTSSVDINTFLKDRRIPLGSIEDIKTLKMAPFDDKTSRIFLESLFFSWDLFPERRILDKIISFSSPGSPYLLQIFAGEIITYCRRLGKLTEEDVEEIYRQKVVGPESRRYFDDFVNHIRGHYGEVRFTRAKVILNALSTSPEGVEGEELKGLYLGNFQTLEDFTILLQYLEYDLYVEKRDSRYRFSSPILRDYWRYNWSKGE